MNSDETISALLKRIDGLQDRLTRLERMEKNTFTSVIVKTLSDANHAFTLRNEAANKTWNIYQIASSDGTYPNYFYIEYFNGSTFAPKLYLTPNGDLFASGDVYTDVWNDWAGSSTIIGWSSFTTKNILYKRIGKLVIISFFLTGPSNATGASFTLPFTANAAYGLTIPIAAQDNGVVVTSPVAYLGNTTTCSLYKDITGTTWTASGTKDIRGQFFYQST